MRLRRIASAAVLLCAMSVIVPSPGGAYHFHAVKWPGGVVPYYNGASGQAWAVSRAVRAWNRRGARIRFVAVPRAQAKVLIEADRRDIYCSEGHATVGFVPNAHVVVFPARGITKACNRFWAAQLMAHELGHVLGLGHEDRYCATMNSRGSHRGGFMCEPRLPWEWRCRLLERDDVAGVAAVYGGRPRPAASPATCPLYSPISPPRDLSVDYDPSGVAITLAFTRPTEPQIPAFVAPRSWIHNAAFALARFPGKCPRTPDVSSAQRFRWEVAVGEKRRIEITLPAERVCVALWALDSLGRPSGRPVTAIASPTAP
jgi:hypothetical protein